MPRRQQKPPRTSVKAVGYARVSTEEQKRVGISLDAQAERIKAYCQYHNLGLVELLSEGGVSAAKPLGSRPLGVRLLRMVGEDDVGHVVSVKLDRLFRNALDCLQVVDDWMHEGVALHLVDFGGEAMNTNTPMGRFFLQNAASFAELERNMISSRTREAIQYKMAHGGIVGQAPIGSKWEGEKRHMRLVTNPEEQAVVQRILELRDDHLSLREIADELNAAGFTGRTRKGVVGRWHPTAVARVLARTRHTTEPSVAGPADGAGESSSKCPKR